MGSDVTQLLEAMRTINVALSALTLTALFIRINSRWDHLHRGVKIIYTGLLFFPFAAMVESIHAYLLHTEPSAGTIFITVACVVTTIGLIVTNHLGSDAVGNHRKGQSDPGS